MSKVRVLTEIEAILLLLARSVTVSGPGNVSSRALNESIVEQARIELRRLHIPWDAPVEDLRDALEKTECWKKTRDGMVASAPTTIEHYHKQEFDTFPDR